MARSEAYFQEAIRIDPDYAAPYAALAEYHAINASSRSCRRPNEGNVPAGQDLCGKSAQPGRHPRRGPYVPGFMAACFDRDWEYAEREFERTFGLDPNLVRARAFHAVIFWPIGRPEEAVAEIRRAQQMDPLSLVLRHQTTRTLYLAGHFQETIAEGQEETRPESHRSLRAGDNGDGLLHLGRLSEALESLERALTPRARPILTATRARVYAATGQPEKSRVAIEECRKRSARGG